MILSSIFGYLHITLLVIICAVHSVSGDESIHKYEQDEMMVIWLNKIGPYHNPQETYTYYTLPFCKPDGNYHEKSAYAGVGEVLEGNELVQSGMKISFNKDTDKTILCEQTLDDDATEAFKYAISQHYWYQLYLDDLPIWGMVGEIVGTEEDLRKMEEISSKTGNKEHEVRDAYIYTHKKFSIAYNGDKVIEVNLTSDNPIEVKEGNKLQFSYSVHWIPTQKSFEKRFNRYLDYTFFEHQIHWFSIFNSFMMVIFLCGLVSLILMRTLRNDYAKYTRDDDAIDGGAPIALDRGFGDDSGWKQVHGDVFRKPSHLILLSACYGAGMQLVFLVIGVILVAISGSLWADRGALITAALILYALTSIVNGYASGSYYNQFFFPNPAPDWIKVMILSLFLFPSMLLILAIGLNFIAMYNATITALPLGTGLTIILGYIIVACPLAVGGTILGRHWSGQSEFPCRVNTLPRPIPERQWYNTPTTIISLTGILPFGAIFIEMFFVMSSMWNFKLYYVYGFLLLVFFILIIVSACVTIVAVYFLLNSEDWRWHWTSFLASASTAVWVWFYSCYYFFFKTHMTGFLQSAFYFGYMAMFSIALGLMCGTIGHFGASIFVRTIFQAIKVD